eukprot:CAMPEP_0197173572 /NCGR_PEP_ID=MMETSP1423-20130617/453_1 /TAXON_ID=476441 /ORGANISM="Pseudo-nitzschia heimii, Strain UNC1101" /LENGTH=842 /DNA_ID=CAMNT_0042622407 /DNA_START=54 /DNA_END=2582 /DNA_ORIENTATION=-
MRFFLPHSVVALWIAQSTDAFQSPTKLAVNRLSPTAPASGTTAIFAESLHEDDENSDASRGRMNRPKISRKVKKSLAFLTPIAIAGSSVGALVGSPQTANAGAPVMAMPKTKAQDPVQVAFDLQDKKLMIEAQKELSEFQAKARSIERERGPAARDQFEKEYKESQAKKAEEHKEGLDQLKRNLLDEGIDPSLDVEGRRQVILYTKGVDLGEIAGTKFNVEKRYEEKGSKDAFAVQKKSHREMIKAMVQDLKNRGMDPLKYFSTHQDKTEMILNLPAEKAAALAAKYNENLELYGQIAAPKEGEKSAKELMAEKGISEKGNGKEAEKRLKAEAKEKAAAEKAAAKAAAKAEKDRLKEEKRAAKEAAKHEKEMAKAAAAAAAISTAAAASASTPAVEPSLSVTPVEDSSVALIDEIPDERTDESSVTTIDDEVSSTGRNKIVPASAILVSVGGGAYAFKMVRERAVAAEEERQRQFKILMGGDTPASSTTATAAGEMMTELIDDEIEIDEQPEPLVEKPPTKKKKRRGLKSVFGKKSNGRETNIENLVAPDAKAAEFSKTLAKILTFGAPGRFPDVTNLPGPMPMESYDLEAARGILTETQSIAGIPKEESAEIFANVVNCMLIDIVDLASTSLKEKDQMVTTDAIGIVITFMDLAASLYTSIADGVDIKPVTYGGDISKSKLEQMYSTYAMSGMTNMANIDEKFDDRVSLLQDVFQINPKKAEGLMLKAMQKNMMEMMNTGEMPEGMEEMMNSMGGMDGMGMPGLGDGEEPDPEQLKEMLRTLKGLKDSGSLPESELAEVRKQFKDAFGSSIDEIMKGADEAGNELGEQDKELLDLMKDILG